MASRNHPSRQSFEDPPIERRHSSASSTHSEDSSQHTSDTRRRKTTRSNRQRTSLDPRSHDENPSVSEQGGLQNHSRRDSTSSMRTSSAPLDGPITYTPTTHRVSKAKKGKRVHACEFPGCNKIFTRAEHKRRHELNHSPEASFPCDRQGCRKAFHRPDLLQRHMERHDLEASAEGLNPSHRRQPSQASMSSEATSGMTTTSMTSPIVAVQSPSHHSTGLSIGSLVHPSTGADSRGLYGSAHMGYESYGRGAAVGLFPGMGSSDESLYYSSESSQSPISDHYAKYPHRASISSSSSMVDLYPNVSQPVMNTTMNGWSQIPPSVLPSSIIDEQRTGYAPSLTDSALPPLPLSDLDGLEWVVIRRELSSNTGAFPPDGIGIFDTVKWQNCLDCYWRFFHPLFPIVHRPTFFATKPSPLMSSAMIAIGSQYDTLCSAKHDSLALLEASTKLLSKRDNITSRSRLTDLQTVFLLEILTKFRSRRADVEVSPRFRSLYASLTQARHWISTSPLAVLKGLPKNPSSDELRKAHKFWVEHETRRRILQASFILDTHQAALFEQPQALVQVPLARLITNDTNADIPVPCDSDLWESSPIEEWAEHAKRFENTSLSAAAENAVSDAPKPMDPFQSRLALSYILMVQARSQDFEDRLITYRRNLAKQPAPYTEFSYHALMIAQLTPVRRLLMVCGETWLFGKKVGNESDFRRAKDGLREWADDATRSGSAMWHATQLLRSVFERSHDEGTGLDPMGCDTELHMLHEQWAMYLAALVCWAFGFHACRSLRAAGTISRTSSTSETHSYSSSSSNESPSTAHPHLLDAVEADMEMRAYLRATDVAQPEDLATLDPEVLCRTNGLLEVVRTRQLVGAMGGLLSEAERVLYRLVEGRSQVAHF